MFNVEDLQNPFLASTFDNGNTAIGHNLYIKAIYCANQLHQWHAGVRLGPKSLGSPRDCVLRHHSSHRCRVIQWSLEHFPVTSGGTVIGSDFDAGFFVWTVAQTIGLSLDANPGEFLPSAGFEASVQISGLSLAALDPNGPKLLWSTDGAANESPLVYQPASDRWVASTGPLPCDGCSWSGRLKLPTTRDFRSPLGPFSGVVADSSDMAFEDDFETNQGWTVSGLATDGWTRGVPITDCDRGNPTNTPNGTSACYLTDNSNNGSCNSDVDRGDTILTSPTLDASDPRRWCPTGGGTTTRLQMVLPQTKTPSMCSVLPMVEPAGSLWRTVQGNSPEANGGWFRKQFLISDFVPNTASFRIRFIGADIVMDHRGIGGGRFCLTTLTCDEAPPAIPGDVDGDGDVDFDDLIGLLAAWGPCGPPCPPDVDGNGSVGFSDLLTLLGNWS